MALDPVWLEAARLHGVVERLAPALEGRVGGGSVGEVDGAVWVQRDGLSARAANLTIDTRKRAPGRK